MKPYLGMENETKSMSDLNVVTYPVGWNWTDQSPIDIWNPNFRSLHSHKYVKFEDLSNISVSFV